MKPVILFLFPKKKPLLSGETKSPIRLFHGGDAKWPNTKYNTTKTIAVESHQDCGKKGIANNGSHIKAWNKTAIHISNLLFFQKSTKYAEKSCKAEPIN